MYYFLHSFTIVVARSKGWETEKVKRNDHKISSAQGALSFYPVCPPPSLPSFSFYFRRFVPGKQSNPTFPLVALTKVWKLSLMEGRKSSLMFFLLQIIIMGFWHRFTVVATWIFIITLAREHGGKEKNHAHYSSASLRPPPYTLPPLNILNFLLLIARALPQ